MPSYSYGPGVSTGGGGPTPAFEEGFTSLGAYTEFATGATPSVDAGKVAAAAMGAWSRFVRTGTSLVDSRQRVTHTPGAVSALGTSHTMLIARYLDASNYLYAEFRVNNSQMFFYVYKMDLGVATTLVSASTAAGEVVAVSGVPLYVTFSVAGNSATFAGYGGHPSIAKPIREATAHLGGADATKFGAGIAGAVGFGIAAVAASDRWDDHVCLTDMGAGF